MERSPIADRLRHVCWIGGGSGGGKSVVARRLAAEHGLELHSTDDTMNDHARRTTPEESPWLAAFMASGMDERWVQRSPEVMLDTFPWFRGEAFDLVVDDLLAGPVERPVIVEGFRLLPERVAPLLADRRRAVWLLPTPDQRRAAFESRGSLWSIAGRTSDAERALANLLARDALFTDRLRREIARLGLVSIEVDVDTTEDDLAPRVAEALSL